MTERPTIDVVMSTFNEERYIDRCMEAVRGQDYPRESVRIWVVDGGSSDRTVELLERHAAADDRIVVIADGERINLPAALNVAIERSDGELVAKVDAHGYPERDFLSRAVEVFTAGGASVACVGGRPVQDGETPFGRALALARTSPVGVGGSGYGETSEHSLVDTVQCGVYRRDVLEAVGSFDPTMNFGEDEELNWRIRRAGHDIVLDTSIRFHYVTRPSWSAAYRQYRNYGGSRVRVVRKHPEYLRAYHLVPAAAVGGGVLLAAAGVVSRPARRVFAAGAGAYAAIVAAAALALDPRQAARVALAFVALHAGYGIGMLREVLRLGPSRS